MEQFTLTIASIEMLQPLDRVKIAAVGFGQRRVLLIELSLVMPAPTRVKVGDRITMFIDGGVL